MLIVFFLNDLCDSWYIFGSTSDLCLYHIDLVLSGCFCPFHRGMLCPPRGNIRQCLSSSAPIGPTRERTDSQSRRSQSPVWWMHLRLCRACCASCRRFVPDEDLLDLNVAHLKWPGGVRMFCLVLAQEEKNTGSRGRGENSWQSGHARGIVHRAGGAAVDCSTEFCLSWVRCLRPTNTLKIRPLS